MSRKVERSYGLHDTRLEDFEGEVREEDLEQDGGESLLLEELFVKSMDWLYLMNTIIDYCSELQQHRIDRIHL